jgi:glucose-1-phosphate adenylyltransferase
VDDSLLGEGTLVLGGTIRRSILGQGVRVEPGAVIEESIIMDHTTVGRNADIRRTIIDRFNVIEPETALGGDRGGARVGGRVDPSGIVVVGRGATRTRRGLPSLQ